jgi:hypothetical protein
MSFQREYSKGLIGESLIAAWFKARGNGVLPAYQVEIETGKGPQFFTADGDFVAPDMLVFGGQRSNGRPPAMLWVEAKHKTAFSWHRESREWCTGIDLRHYEQYQQVERISRLPVWVMFLHRQDRPSDRDLAAGCPSKCPTGLFGAALDSLKGCVHHRSANWGRDGMVYWTPSDFRLFANSDELEYLHGYRPRGKAVIK